MRQLFTVRTARQLFYLDDSAGRIAEIAVDGTTVESDTGKPGSLSRIEVEVEPDAVDRAQRFVDLFVATAALGPASKSKFETALHAAGLVIAPKSPDLGPAAVSAGMSAADAGFAIMRKQFGVFLANEASTRLGEDIEGLHDMRVAARRLRAAMSAFAAYLPPTTQRYREQLGWIAAALGDVRDLDVQLEDMATWRQGFDAHQAASLDAVEQLFRGRRIVARRRMLFALDSRRYEGFVLRFTRFLQHGPPRTFTAGRQPLVEVAPQLLEKRYRKLRKLGDAIEPGSPPAEYHILRIAGKKLRYALEFMGPVYGSDAIAFSQRVTALQDVLGRHQDAEVVIEVLDELARIYGRRIGHQALLVMGAIAERNRMEAARLRREYPHVYKPLRGPEWKRLHRDFAKHTGTL
jgi:CHAD domain-containing protein